MCIKSRREKRDQPSSSVHSVLIKCSCAPFYIYIYIYIYVAIHALASMPCAPFCLFVEKMAVTPINTAHTWVSFTYAMSPTTEK
jgi:hypothetical protein